MKSIASLWVMSSAINKAPLREPPCWMLSVVVLNISINGMIPSLGYCFLIIAPFGRISVREIPCPCWDLNVCAS